MENKANQSIAKALTYMEQQKGKSPKESAVETRYILMPQHANPQGTAFGGVILVRFRLPCPKHFQL
jgi:hypothetical protein